MVGDMYLFFELVLQEVVLIALWFLQALKVAEIMVHVLFLSG